MTKFFSTVFVLGFFTTAFGFSIEPYYTVIAKSKKGIQVRREEIRSPDGGLLVSFQITDKKSKIKYNYEISDTTYYRANAINPMAEKISTETCQARLRDLRKVLKRYKIKKARVVVDACLKNVSRLHGVVPEVGTH